MIIKATFIIISNVYICFCLSLKQRGITVREIKVHQFCYGFECPIMINCSKNKQKTPKRSTSVNRSIDYEPTFLISPVIHTSLDPSSWSLPLLLIFYLQLYDKASTFLKQTSPYIDSKMIVLVSEIFFFFLETVQFLSKWTEI